MTKAILIARVSTDDQAKDGFSLAAQLQATRKYAEARGWEIAGEFVDDGVSGAIPFADRPAGARAWAMLKSGAADALICQNVDRLSRDVVDLLVTIRELLRLGVEVHCLDLGRVTSEYDIMLVIRGWQGSDERAKILERSLRGKREKLAQGMVIGGRRPYGYDFLRDARGKIVNFVINENEAQVVRLIYRLYTQGNGNGIPLSLYAVGQYLTTAGIPTAWAARRSYQAWSPTTLTRILKNTLYKGEWRYHFTETDETFIIKVPALVDAETWEAAQTQRKHNSSKAARNAKHEYLLRGIVKCDCGYSMVGGGRKSYYICSSRAHFTKEARSCRAPFVRADKLEALVWDYFKSMLTDPATFEANLRAAQAAELEAQNPQRAELETVTALIREAEAEAAQLAQALTKARGIVHKTLEDRMTQLNARYEALATRREALEVALQQRLTEEAIKAALALASDVRLGIENADNAVKRRILDLFDTRITVKDGGLVLVTYSIETKPIELQLPIQTQPNHKRAVITVKLCL